MSKTGEPAIASCSARYFYVPSRTVHPASILITAAGFLVDVKADEAQNKNVWSLKSFLSNVLYNIIRNKLLVILWFVPSSWLLISVCLCILSFVTPAAVCPYRNCRVPSSSAVNLLNPNDPYSGRTAPLTSKLCILYIYSTNIGTEYFKRGIYSTFFHLQNVVFS
jgi:hypothetical protein